MAKKNNANDIDKPKSSKPFVIFAVILALAIAISSWVYLIKTNKFFGLGEILRPRLKDVPIVCMILPEITDPTADPNLMAREEINYKYSKILAENTELQKTVTELKVKLSSKEDIESKYEILLKEVERQSKQILNYQKAEETAELQAKSEEAEAQKIKDIVKLYETMDAAESAKILEEMGELNISLVVEICKEMKTATFAEVLQNMSTEFAAILSERMAS